MSKKTNKIILIFTLLSIFFILNISYGKNFNVLATSDTVTSYGDFNIEFKNLTIVKSAGVNLSNVQNKISSNSTDLSVNVPDLAYPGAGVEFSVDITNRGTISAKLESINITGLNDDSMIKVNVLDKENIANTVLEPEDVYNLHFTVEWDKNYNTVINEESNFKISINYVQAFQKA